MTVEEFFEFHPEKYLASLQGLTKEEVQHLHLVCKRNFLGTLASDGIAGFMAVPTWGFSLILGGVSIRRGSVLSQKLQVLEAYMNEKGWEEVHMDAGDFALAVGPMAVAAAVAPGAEHLTTALAGHGTTQFVAQNASHVASMAHDSTNTFVHAVAGGAHDQVAAVVHGLSGSPVPLVNTADVMNASAVYAGNALGQAGAQGLEVYGARKGANLLTERALHSKEEKEMETRIKQQLETGSNSKNGGIQGG